MTILKAEKQNCREEKRFLVLRFGR